MAPKPIILAIGLSDAILTVVKSISPDLEFIFKGYADIDDVVSSPIEPRPLMILCGPPTNGVALTEVAQGLSMQYAETPVFYLTTTRTGFDRKAIQKNGMTEAFLLPIDEGTMIAAMKEHIAKQSGARIEAYKPVSFVDFGADVIPDFDTYILLPLNKRYVRYAAARESFDSKRLERLGDHHMNTLYIQATQMQKFFEFTADRLRKIGASTEISETERREKLKSAVRNLMADMFNDADQSTTIDRGRSIVSDCRSIVTAYISGASKKSSSWYARLLEASGTAGDIQSHASNAATFAALFSIGTGIGDPEALAMAGLLHDIGIADVPAEIQNKPETDWTLAERKEFQKHPLHSIEMIKARKLIVPDEVTACILQHHERYDGQGYPHQLPAHRLSKSAQILAIADLFDDLTSSLAGHQRLTPIEAIRKIRADEISRVGGPAFDPKVLAAVFQLFPDPKSEIASPRRTA